MSAETLPTSRVADLMSTPLVTLYQMLTKPEIQPVLPPPATNGGTRNFNERQTLLMMLAADMVRSGMKFPLAASWACEFGERLAFNPEASSVHVEFRRSGAMFFFTSDDAPEAGEHAGPRRFRMTFDLDAYRAAIRTAMSKVA